MNEENTAFKPGDLAVLQNATHYHEYNGWLVEILGPPGEKWVMDTRIMERVLIFAYPVRLIYENAEALPRGGRFQCMPWQLRRIEEGAQILEIARRSLSDGSFNRAVSKPLTK